MALRSLDQFARRLAVLALGSGEQVESAKAIGARTQLSLLAPGGGTVFPDLSLDGADRSFQVLIEVKVDAAFHTFTDQLGAEVLQPDFYRLAWLAMPADQEAHVRAVATLTRSGTDVAPDLAQLRGRDLSWTEVANELDQLVADHEIDTEVVLVARSFLIEIRNRIAPRKVDPTELQARVSGFSGVERVGVMDGGGAWGEAV